VEQAIGIVVYQGLDGDGLPSVNLCAAERREERRRKRDGVRKR
jgi:hypothetical protein